MHRSLTQVSLTVMLWVCVSCGSPPPSEGDAMESSAVSEAELALGKEVYDASCLSCHQVDGGGVPGLNPPLIGTDWVLGDKSRLIKVVLNGLNEPIVIEDETYSNVMPSLSYLSDEDIAYVLTYVRNDFGNQASPITSSDVAQIRSSLADTL
ncbi:MAG: c-type cytochrome [Bacteroidota bacterium]